MLVCDRRELAEAVKVLNSIIPRKPVNVALENILFRTLGKNLCLLATDMEVGLMIELEKVEISDSTKFLIPGAKLLAILRELDGETVEFHKEEGFVKLLCGEDEFRLLSIPVEDFPEFIFSSKERLLSLPADELRGILRKVSFAAAPEAASYVMNSVLFNLKDGTLSLVGTDGKRLSVAKLDVDSEGEHFLLFPIKGVRLLEKVLEKHEGEVELFLEENKVLVRTDCGSVYINLLKGNYPPYESVVPEEYPLKVKVDRKLFYKALCKATLLASSGPFAVDFHFKEKTLTLCSKDPCSGEAKVTVPLESPVAEELLIRFNPKLLIDAVKVSERHFLHLEFKDHRSPCVFREDCWVYAVMPIMLDDPPF